MTFKTATEVQAALKQALIKDVASYIEYLDAQSPIVSDSHHRLRALYQSYGRNAVDVEIDHQLRAAERGDEIDAAEYICDDR